MSQLVIYALQVGGGTLALCALPGRGGDYAGDLDMIAAWRPGLVISMTTEAEMVAVGAHHFGAEIRQVHGGESCGRPVGKIQYAQTAQCLGHGGSCAFS